METTISQNPSHASSQTEKAKPASAFSAFLDELETNRFGFAPLMLLIVACLGGIAAGFCCSGK